MLPSKRKIGKKLEEMIAQYLREWGDKNARPTKASGGGNSTEIEDILSSYFYCQAKVNRATENINIKYKDWVKMLNNMPITTMKLPLFFYENKAGKIFVVCNIKDFFKRLLRKPEDL